MPSIPDISVLIPTLNRGASLQVTLQCLADAACDDITAEVVVIDNGSSDNTREVARRYAEKRALRYMWEPAPKSVYGKPHALNRALDAGGLGGVVAVLDDDMSPHPERLKGVMSICRRWPEKDIFTGRSYVIWPPGAVPGWASDGRIRSWAFSVMDQGDQDRPLEKGRWFSGGHVWYRSRVFAFGRRFETVWTADSANLILQLADEGYEGSTARMPWPVIGYSLTCWMKPPSAIAPSWSADALPTPGCGPTRGPSDRRSTSDSIQFSAACSASRTPRDG